MFAFLLSVFLLAIACASADSLSGADIISSVTAAEWDNAADNKIVVTINENPNYSFSPTDLSVVAGTAYILRIENNATNTGKHYYSAPGLFATSAMRKIQTNMAEMKADFLGDVELLVPGDGVATWVEYFFVPMVAGTYDVICTIADHALLGMNGTITVTDDNNIKDTLITDWADDYSVDTKASPDDRRSGSHPVWMDVETVEVEILSPYAPPNMTGYAFSPSNLELIVGKGYILKIKQIGDGSNDKHYYTAPEFFKSVVTRKLQDASAEVKFPYINAVELTDTPELAGQETYIDLYIVPTVAGVYDVICTISGHAEAGMRGTITVVTGNDTSGAAVLTRSFLLPILPTLYMFVF